MSQRAEHRDCCAVRDRLDAVLDGELDPRETGRLLRHLEACAPCSAELRRAEELREELRAMPVFHVPDRVARAVAAATAMPDGVRPDSRTSARRWMPVAAAVAAAVLVAALVGPRRSGVNSVAPEDAAAREAAAEARLAVHLLVGATRHAERRARARVLDGAVAPTAQRVSASLWWLRDAGAPLPARHEQRETSTAEGSL